MGNWVVVFRSADVDAKEDARLVQRMLASEGMEASVFDDSALGVPVGAWEVRVEGAQQARADTLVAAMTAAQEAKPIETSHDLDLVTVFEATGMLAEMEGTSIQSMLESNGIQAVLVGGSPFPNLPAVVQVSRDHVVQAKQLIAEALAAGPAGAEEAEVEGETAGQKAPEE